MATIFHVDEYFVGLEPYSIGFYIEHRKLFLHSHEFWEVSYVFEGNGVHHFADGSSKKIGPGDVLFISPGPIHCITSPPEGKGSWVRTCNFLIRPEAMQGLLGQIGEIGEMRGYDLLERIRKQRPFCLQLESRSQSIYSLMLAAAHEYNHFTDGSREIIDSCARNLLICLIRLHEYSQREENALFTKKDVIDELCKYIRSNFGSDLSLPHLAAYAHLSPEYLSRYFKKYTGQNLSAFIRETRLERAKYMLLNSNLVINEIGIYCGFGSIGNFQKVFKADTGMSAGAYRAMHGGKEEI